jgi:hypothetical protein
VDHKQVGYRGLFPGKSTVEDVETLLGTPEQVWESPLRYSYSDRHIGILFGEDKVSYYLSIDGHEVKQTLEEIVLQNGCPNIIYGFNQSEDMPSDGYTYASLSFIYLELGIELYFSGMSLSVQNKPDGISYFIPTSLVEYLNLYIGDTSDSTRTRVFSWDEVVNVHP